VTPSKGYHEANILVQEHECIETQSSRRLEISLFSIKDILKRMPRVSGYSIKGNGP
jgi:hypothetical protein